MAQLQDMKGILKSEIIRLQELCSKWENISLESTVPEESNGTILSALGQTQLLLRKKLKQFENLIVICENGKPDSKITMNDLQGFWDLIRIQIDDVDTRFQHLEQQKLNNWSSELKLMQSLTPK